jgi:hypothetical protein
MDPIAEKKPARQSAGLKCQNRKAAELWITEAF